MERIISVFPPEQQKQIIIQLANCLQGILAQRLVPSAGQKDRVLATELLVANSAVRSHIRGQEFHQLLNVIQTGGRENMHSMDDSLIELYKTGKITYETAIDNAYNPKEIDKRIF